MFTDYYSILPMRKVPLESEMTERFESGTLPRFRRMEQGQALHAIRALLDENEEHNGIAAYPQSNRRNP